MFGDLFILYYYYIIIIFIFLELRTDENVQIVNVCGPMI